MQHCTVTSKTLNSRCTLGQRFWRRWVAMCVVGLSLMAFTAWVANGSSATAAETSPQNAASTKPATDQAAPVIHVDKPEYDFGEQWVGPGVDFFFTIQNKGKSTLKINGVYPGCGGCTTVGDYPKEIEPGQSGKFPFVLKTQVLRGTVTKTISIASNDPATPTLALKIRGIFRKRIELSPSVAFFGSVIGDRPASRVVKIKNNTDKPLELKMDPVKSDQFSFNLVETVPGKQFVLRVTTILPHKAGDIAATAVLNSNIPEEKVVKVTATGRIPDRLDLFPSTVTYTKPQQLPPGKEFVQLSFWLNNYGASLVEVKEAVINDPAIKTTVDVRSPGKNYRIEISVPVNITIPAEGRVLTIRTNDPEKPVLTARIMSQTPPKSSAKTKVTTNQASRPAPISPDTLIGKPAPTFNLKTLDGKELTSAIKGKITVLNFVSTMCPWCKKQLPEVEKVRAAYQDKGVRFVNVVNPNPTRQNVLTAEQITKAFVEMNSNLEIATDEGSKVAKSFHAHGYPALYVIGKDGNVAAVDYGFSKVRLLQSQIEAALAGKPIPTSSQPQ